MTKTCGEAIVTALECAGVEQVFGIPGVHNLELYRGLAKSSIKHTLARHEQGAGFMADGYARATSKLGVAFVITGPGVTNISTAIGQAYSDSIPMLVISSVNESWSLSKGTGRLHESKDQLKFTESVTAFSARATTTADVGELLQKAFDVFSSERPRPVHIEIPLDVLAEPTDDEWHLNTSNQRPTETGHCRYIAHLLDEANSPMMIVGGGAVDCGDLVKKLAHHIEMPVFSTVAGKGIMPAKDPFNAGATLCTPAGWEMIGEADVLLVVGSEMADTDFWRDRLPLANDVKIIRVDIDESKLNDLYQPYVGVVSDAENFLQALVLSLPEEHVAKRDLSMRIQALKAQVRNELSRLDQSHQKIIKTIENTIYPNSIIASDMTQIAYAANFLIEPSDSRKWLHPTGFGTLGYALPAGIGAAIGTGLPTCVLAGDGGFQYSIMELATAKESIETPFIVLLWNNSRLGQIWDDMEASNIEPIAVAMHNPDFQSLAESYGFNAFAPASVDELERQLLALVGTPGVHFVEIDAKRIFMETE